MLPAQRGAVKALASALPLLSVLPLGLLALLTLSLSACASAPVAEPPPDAALHGDVEPYIVLAVANDPGFAPVHPGSTSRSYAASGDYRVSDGARRALRTLAAQYHLQQVAAWPIAVLHMQCAVFALPAGASRELVLRTLQSDRRVALAEPLQSYSVQTADDPYASVQSGNERMDVAQAHRLSRGRGVRIALIDTGLDSEHPELQGRVDIQRNFVDHDAKQFQLDRHGTAVAGVIAADADNGKGIAGIAPEARLLALKACWQLQAGRDDARCNSFTLAQALASAIELKASIINLSLTGPADPLLAALAEQATRAGIIIVGAAPQPAPPAVSSQAASLQTGAFPGSLAHVLGVARSEDQAVPPGVLQAPGREVLTLAPGGRYDFASGSSISTGEITGVTALLLARESNLDAARVLALLSEATETVTTAAGTTRTVNACRALLQLTRSGTCAAAAASTAAR